MTRSLAAAALGGLVLLGAGDAQALSSEAVRANVPFAFTVGGATLPAGEYRVSYDDVEVAGVLAIRSQDGRHHAFVMAEPVDAAKATGEPRLVFEREGSSYRLAEVIAPATRAELDVLKTQPAH